MGPIFRKHLCSSHIGRVLDVLPGIIRHEEDPDVRLAVSRVSTASANVLSKDWTGWRAGLGTSNSACFFVVIVESCAAMVKDIMNAAAAAAI